MELGLRSTFREKLPARLLRGSTSDGISSKSVSAMCSLRSLHSHIPARPGAMDCGAARRAARENFAPATECDSNAQSAKKNANPVSFRAFEPKIYCGGGPVAGDLQVWLGYGSFGLGKVTVENSKMLKHGREIRVIIPDDDESGMVTHPLDMSLVPHAIISHFSVLILSLLKGPSPLRLRASPSRRPLSRLVDCSDERRTKSETTV